ncbi:sensor histidine kinase [Paenibacillus sp. SAF-054]|uniref:sensor histidine kinase n=1 Tax=unclassified Paenibacillus TaxID=185978 RepID=UPI003F809C62
MIENYVLHGFRADRPDNRIMIEGRMQSGNVQIQIRDNGWGIPYEELLEIRQSFRVREEWDGKPQSIGLRNVNSRIQMYYGSEYGLEIESEDGAGTCIRITIPAGKE